MALGRPCMEQLVKKVLMSQVKERSSHWSSSSSNNFTLLSSSRIAASISSSSSCSSKPRGRFLVKTAVTANISFSENLTFILDRWGESYLRTSLIQCKSYYITNKSISIFGWISQVTYGITINCTLKKKFWGEAMEKKWDYKVEQLSTLWKCSHREFLE